MRQIIYLCLLLIAVCSCDSSRSKEESRVADSIQRANAVFKAEEEEYEALKKMKSQHKELKSRSDDIDRVKSSYQVNISYKKYLIESENENLIQNGYLDLAFNKNFDLARIAISAHIYYGASGEEEGYEETHNLMYTTVDYDTAQNIKLISNYGFLANRNDTVFLNKNYKDEYFAMKMSVAIPSLKDILTEMDFYSFSIEEDVKSGSKFKIVSARSDQISKVGLNVIKTNLNRFENYTKEDPKSKDWLPDKTGYIPENKSTGNWFNPDKGQITIQTSESNILEFLNHYFKKMGVIKQHNYDTLHYSYWDPSRNRKVSVQPTIQIGNQKWMAVNTGYIYPTSILGKSEIVKSLRESCPNGWHVPSKEEWETLFQFLGGYDAAAKALISDNPMYWISSDSEYNKTGFNVIQSSTDPNFTPFSAFITSTEISADEIVMVYFTQRPEGPTAGYDKSNKNWELSCRCVAD